MILNICKRLILTNFQKGVCCSPGPLAHTSTTLPSHTALVHESIAVLSAHSTSFPCHRDRHIADIQSIGWSDWKRQSGYNLQSHGENAFYRYNRIIGGWMRAKNDEAQKRESVIGCAILNRMLEMGEPLSCSVG